MPWKYYQCISELYVHLLSQRLSTFPIVSVQDHFFLWPLMTHTHTHTHTHTLARTPVGEWSARRRGRYLTDTTKTRDRQSCRPSGFQQGPHKSSAGRPEPHSTLPPVWAVYISRHNIYKAKVSEKYCVCAKAKFAPLMYRSGTMSCPHERSAGATRHHFNAIWRSASTGSSVMQLLGQEFSLRALLREHNLLTKCGEHGGRRASKKRNHICGQDNVLSCVQNSRPN